MQRPVGKTDNFGKLRLLEALQAIKAHGDAAEKGAPPAEVAQLRYLADLLYEAVVEYRLLRSGDLSDSSVGIASPRMKKPRA